MLMSLVQAIIFQVKLSVSFPLVSLKKYKHSVSESMKEW